MLNKGNRLVRLHCELVMLYAIYMCLYKLRFPTIRTMSSHCVPPCFILGKTLHYEGLHGIKLYRIGWPCKLIRRLKVCSLIVQTLIDYLLIEVVKREVTNLNREGMFTLLTNPWNKRDYPLWKNCTWINFMVYINFLMNFLITTCTRDYRFVLFLVRGII